MFYDSRDSNRLDTPQKSTHIFTNLKHFPTFRFSYAKIILIKYTNMITSKCYKSYKIYLKKKNPKGKKLFNSNGNGILI